jgi:hypothetical protein
MAMAVVESRPPLESTTALGKILILFMNLRLPGCIDHQCKKSADSARLLQFCANRIEAPSAV